MDSNTDRPATGSRRHAPGRRARSLQGEHLWGRYTVQPVTRALWSARTLEVYPPGTNATELLFLRAWHAWRLGGPLTAAVLLLVLHDRPFVAVGLTVCLVVARRLDLLSLGDRAARHLGVDVERLRIVAILAIAMLVGAGVAFAGVIAFVGLVVPHLVRLVAGPGHRLLLPASALGGAVLLVLADLIARTAVEFADMPLGMLTSIVGGPFFLWLMRRMRRSQGGWA